jgi:MtN3 and saliva related transmembrane protein
MMDKFLKMDKITIIGIIASACTGISLLPQLLKMIREKKSEGVSSIMLIVLFAGLGFWIYYGFLKMDWIIIISNSVSLMINITIAILTLIYRNQKPPAGLVM